MSNIIISALYQILLEQHNHRGCMSEACKGEMESIYRLLIGGLEGTRLHGRPWHRWEENIKVDLKEICLEVVE
jgi:hypothetical protein